MKQLAIYNNTHNMINNYQEKDNTLAIYSPFYLLLYVKNSYRQFKLSNVLPLVP